MDATDWGVVQAERRDARESYIARLDPVRGHLIHDAIEDGGVNEVIVDQVWAVLLKWPWNYLENI